MIMFSKYVFLFLAILLDFFCSLASFLGIFYYHGYIYHLKHNIFIKFTVNFISIFYLLGLASKHI